MAINIEADIERTKAREQELISRIESETKRFADAGNDFTKTRLYGSLQENLKKARTDLASMSGPRPLSGLSLEEQQSLIKREEEHRIANIPGTRGMVNVPGKSNLIPFEEGAKILKDSPIVTSDQIRAEERETEESKRKAEMDKLVQIEMDKRQAEADAIKAKIEPSGGKPAAIDRVATFEELRKQGGVVKIEDEITSLRSEKADLLARFSAFKRKEPEAISKGFATGRISEEAQNIQDRIDFLTRQEMVATERLNAKNKYIENVMNLTDADYDDAVARYDKEFNQNMQIQSAVNQYKTAQQAEDNRLRDDARAYLTSVSNLVKDSGKKWEDVDAAMKADIRAAELRAGYAPGTIEAFARAKPKANLLGSRDGYTQDGNAITTLIYDDGLGGVKTTVVKTGGTKTSDEAGEAPNLRTVTDIKNYIKENPEATRADLQALMDKDKTLTQTSITQLLDEAGVIRDFPDSSVPAAIDAVKKLIRDKKLTQAAFDAMINSGTITSNNVKYKLTPEQVNKLKAGTQDFWQWLIPGGR